MNRRTVDVIIYESSSFGGCYDYSIALHKAYRKDSRVSACTLLLPRNAQVELEGVCGRLVSDQPRSLTKFHFLWRQLVNPIRLFWFVRGLPQSLVLFNDFEQLTSFLWVWLFKQFAGQHTYAVFLHDPDRDAYPPSKSISSWCMRHMMSLMEWGFYHESLPERSYYSHKPTKYLSLPHGIYGLPSPDKELFASLSAQKGERSLMLILGAIRSEKNYRLAISLLPEFPEVDLLIAGKPASSRETTEALSSLARESGVEDRVIIVDRFLSYAEMSACVEVCDIVWLNYARSFQSQSAIFNTIAPYQKKILVAGGDSAMARLADQFEVGSTVVPDDFESARSGLAELLQAQDPEWRKYLAYASWDRQIDTVLNRLTDNEVVNEESA